MKISELILALAQIQVDHGDLPVCCGDEFFQASDANEVSSIEKINKGSFCSLQGRVSGDYVRINS